MKSVPDEEQIEQMLENIAIQPGARLDRRLSGAPWTPRAAARRRILTTIGMAFLAVALLTAVTPQGRVFAQGILQFFTRTQSDTRPVPTLILAADPDLSTTAPEPTIQFPDRRLAFEETCGDIAHPRCGLDEIRALVDFPVQGLGETVAGLTFAGATGGPERVIMVYLGENVNGALIIFAEPAGASTQSVPPVAASAKVETVSINGAAGEYVQGGWFSIDGSDGVSWMNDPFKQTLRWDAGSVRYTLTFSAGKDTGVTLEKTDLLYMADHMTTAVKASLAPPAPAMTATDISRQVGFEVIEPGWVPDGYTYRSAGYAPDMNAACLYYSYGEGNLPVLAIAQRPTGSSILDEISISVVDVNGKAIAIPLVTEQIPVGGAQDGQALLISNGVNAAKFCPEKDFVANQALYWWFAGKEYVIFGLLDQYEGGVFISRLEMQRLAENLTGVSTLPHDNLDPQRLRSVTDAQTLAGFPVKAAVQNVSGLHLDHTVHWADEQAETVRLIYTPEEKLTRGGTGYGLFITQAKGAIRTLDEVNGWGGFEYVTINQQTALYRKMCWETMTGGTDCRQELSWDENGIGYDLNVYLPGALPEEEFFAIAENMK